MNWRYLQLICRYLQFHWRYLQIPSICRYLQLNCRYLQINCRCLQFNWIYLQILSICRYLQLNCRYLQMCRFADIYNSIGDTYNSAAKVALVNKILSLWASYLYNIMARSVQEITSFTLVSILIIIIHNVINNKVFLYTAFD